MSTRLILEDVSKTFVEKKAVKGISFSLNKPGVFGLLGTNGAGKTTTIRMLLGIIKKDSGEITWNGKKVDRKSVNFGYLPEERGVYPKVKIYDQLMYFAELKGMKKQEADAAIKDWAKKLRVEEYMQMPAEKLSKGNQQKIQFISAVINEPKLLILDEPFTGLDPINVGLLKSAVKELQQKGCSIIFSSHQMEYIEDFCEQLIILVHGKAILNGSLDEIKENYAKKNVLIKGENIKVSDISKIKGVTSIDKKANEIVVHIENVDVAPKVFDCIKNANISKYVVADAPLNEIFIHYVGGKNE